MTEWQQRMACRDTDPEVFFPERAKDGKPRNPRPALRLCQGCPVRRECAGAARAAGVNRGIVAGIDFDENGAKSTAPKALALVADAVRHVRLLEDIDTEFGMYAAATIVPVKSVAARFVSVWVSAHVSVDVPVGKVVAAC